MRRLTQLGEVSGERHRPALGRGALAAADQRCHVSGADDFRRGQFMLGSSAGGEKSPSAGWVELCWHDGAVSGCGRLRVRAAGRAAASPGFVAGLAVGEQTGERAAHRRDARDRGQVEVGHHGPHLVGHLLTDPGDLMPGGAELAGDLRQALGTDHDEDDDEDHEDLRRVETAHDGSVYKAGSPPTRADRACLRLRR